MSIISNALQKMPGVVSLKVAMEQEGITAQTEQEITIYAKIGNNEGLQQASFIEQQEQAEIKTDLGKIRVRKTIKNGRLATYTMTTKKRIESGSIITNREREKTINNVIYEMFMDLCPQFLSKTRYTFKTEQLTIKRGNLEATIKTSDLAFEVDVFTKKDGSISEWCKIDVETDKIAQILKDNNISVGDVKLIACISKLPFEPNTIVIDDGDDSDKDKQALLKALYEKEFLINKDD